MKLHYLSQEREDQFRDFHEKVCASHERCGNLYSGYPYKLHLDAVVNVGRQYLDLIDEEDKFDVLCALSLHDSMEDCRMNWNDIVKCSSRKTADIVYNVTNELGRNRKERSQKTYPKIATCRLSTFVKLCDRIANMKFSYFCNDAKGMFSLYKSEHPEFYKSLYNEDHGLDEMWKELQALGLH